MRNVGFLILGFILAAIAPLNSAFAIGMPAQYEALGINLNVSYSGIRHMETKDGQFDSLVRQAPQKMRMEMQSGEHSSVVIVREDTGMNYMLMPSMKSYMEIGADKVQQSAGPQMEITEHKKVGNEEINGYDCTKYRAKFSDAEGGKGGGYYWVNDYGILMKADMIYQSREQKGQRIVMELRDLQVGNQDPAHFEVPAGYSSFGVGAGALGQLPTQQHRGAQPGHNENPEYQQPNLGEQVGEAAKQESEQSVINETRRGVRKAFGKIFNRN